MNKLEITTYKEARKQRAKCRLYTDNKIKRISGHRFVSLFGKNTFTRSNLDLLLGFFGLAPFSVIYADFVKIGQFLEEPAVQTQCERYLMYEYTTDETDPSGKGNWGDMFNDPNFTGLIDAYDLDHYQLLEIKTFYFKYKLKFKYDWRSDRKIPMLPDSYYLQARLYLYLWNKNFPNKKVKQINVVAYHVDEKQQEKILEFLNLYANDPDPGFVTLQRNKVIKFNKNNLYIFPIYVDNTFNKLIDIALERQKCLCKVHISPENKTYYEVDIKYSVIIKGLLEEIIKEDKMEVFINGKRQKV